MAIFEAHNKFKANLNVSKDYVIKYKLDTGCSITTIPLQDISNMYEISADMINDYLQNDSLTIVSHLADGRNISTQLVSLSNVQLDDIFIPKLFAITSTSVDLQPLLGMDIIRCCNLTNNHDTFTLSNFDYKQYMIDKQNIINKAIEIKYLHTSIITESNVCDFCIEYLRRLNIQSKDPVATVAAMCNPSWDDSSEQWKRAAYVLKQELNLV